MIEASTVWLTFAEIWERLLITSVAVFCANTDLILSSAIDVIFDSSLSIEPYSVAILSTCAESIEYCKYI